MQSAKASRGWCGDECDKVGVFIVLDRPGDWEEFEASEAKQMNELLTTLHLEVVILDLKIKMMEAIESGYYDLAMTMQLLILVRNDELSAHKFAMPVKQWSVYRTMSP